MPLRLSPERGELLGRDARRGRPRREVAAGERRRGAGEARGCARRAPARARCPRATQSRSTTIIATITRRRTTASSGATPVSGSAAVITPHRCRSLTGGATPRRPRVVARGSARVPGATRDLAQDLPGCSGVLAGSGPRENPSRGTRRAPRRRCARGSGSASCSRSSPTPGPARAPAVTCRSSSVRRRLPASRLARSPRMLDSSVGSTASRIARLAHDAHGQRGRRRATPAGPTTRRVFTPSRLLPAERVAHARAPCGSGPATSRRAPPSGAGGARGRPRCAGRRRRCPSRGGSSAPRA